MDAGSLPQLHRVYVSAASCWRVGDTALVVQNVAGAPGRRRGHWELDAMTDQAYSWLVDQELDRVRFDTRREALRATAALLQVRPLPTTRPVSVTMAEDGSVAGRPGLTVRRRGRGCWVLEHPLMGAFEMPTLREACCAIAMWDRHAARLYQTSADSVLA